jgi:hypothetical protein
VRLDLRALLAKQGTLFACVVIGVALCAPALGNNLQGEDYGQRAAAQRAPWTAPLYMSGQPNPRAIYGLVDRGVLPWITHQQVHVSFFRPLGSLSLHVDYRFWPERPAAMFAHSLLWLAIMTAATVWLYRRVVRPEWAAGLSAVLCAFDDVHGAAIGWLAARHGLVAGAFGILAIALHDRWRRGGSRACAVLAPAALLLALLAGEIGVGAIAYLFAHALFLDPAPPRARWRAALGWCAVVVLWAVLYRLSGAGAYGSGLYIHPLGEPLAFAGAAVQRFAFLFVGVFAAPPADFWSFLPAAERARWMPIAWCVVLGVVALFVPLARRDRTLRFWLFGTVLSMLAACGAPASDRNAIFPALGASASIATLIGRLADRDPAAPAARVWRWPARAASWCWLAINLVLSPLALPLRTMGLRAHNDATALAAADLGAAAGQHLILVNALDFYTAAAAVTIGVIQKPPGPECSRVLYAGLSAIEVSRPDRYTLTVSAPRGFMENELNRVYRGERHPLHAGWGLQLTQVLVRVQRVDERGDPTLVEFSFANPLEHPMYRWMTFQNGRFLPFSPPAVGRKLLIAPFPAAPGG